MKTTFQPTLVFIGPPSNIHSFFVVFDDIRYECESIVECVQLAFAIFCALDVAYPVESEQIWLFLQETLFHIKLPGSKTSLSATRLIGQCSTVA